MNEYKITYTVEGVTGEHSEFITDRSEEDAKKFFNSTAEKQGKIFLKIQPWNTDVPATKRNERETLEEIKNLVSGLGETSHLAIAFEGCFEDAESNIENDCADSYKRRYKLSVRKHDDDAESIKQLKSDIALLSSALENERALTKSFEQRVELLNRQILSSDDLTDISQMLTDKTFGLDGEMKGAAQRIVDVAENPDSAMFKTAVTDHRAAKADWIYYSALLLRVNAIKDGVGEKNS